ncbi:tetratricopeptide repeat protein [Oxalobacteraceae bacterium R-40]|uniref:Tetratricopeptide repeat protein n=1 Tax=Keguizhuia sedimenti TaxID=3064264 RepID=A0ABU1BIZ4_9BURK|nr:tetratricopeptide repeat protein [Oxalobacteraceae bacterium R-40]
MKNFLVLAPLLLALSACATGPFAPAAKTDDAIAIASASEKNKRDSTGVHAKNPDASRENNTASVPPSQLSEEILYKYLTAELAEQRGNWRSAYVTMLSLAQQTRDPRIARRAMEVAISAKQSGEALAAIRMWRELAPHSEEAMQYHLGLIVLGDNLSEAQPILAQHLKETQPQLIGPTFLQIQRLLTRAKDKKAAFVLLENLSLPYRTVPEAHLALAQAAALQGDAKRAKAEVQEALALAPNSELAALTLAQITTDKQEAAQALSGFLKAHPNSREVRLAYARILIELKQYDQARAEFKTLLKDKPDDLTTLYALGLLGAQSDDLNEAESYLKKYLDALEAQPEEDRDPSQALLLLAQIAEERNDTQGALGWLEQVDPDSPQAYMTALVKRAQLIAKAGDLTAARKLLQEHPAEGETERVQMITAEAQLMQSLKRSAEAMNIMEKGLKRFPGNTDLLYEYAMLAEKANKLEIMESTLRKLIKIAPNNQHAYNALGYSFADRNIRLQEAFELISKALTLAPEDPFIIDSMGWVQFRLGRLKEAEALLRRAYEMRPDAEIAAHLGEVLWAKGQKEDAKNLWREANNKDPKNDTLKSTLARLQVRL